MAWAEEVHIGKDATLFLLQGTNNVSSQYKKSDEAKFFQIHWQTTIHARGKRLKGMGIVYKQVLIPEKLTIYDNLLNNIDIDWRLSPANRLYNEDQYYSRFPFRRLRVDKYLRRYAQRKNLLIDLIGPMRADRDKQSLYYRTDSHLSFAGRILAYQQICRALEAEPVRDFWERPTVYHAGWVGDLGKNFVPPLYEGTTLHNLQRDSVRVYASPIVELRERQGQEGTIQTGAHVVYRNKIAKDSRTLLLFGDSYANCMPIGLTIMLAETFKELHFIWSTQLDYGYIEKTRPDLVLAEMSERFVFRPVDDSWDMNSYVQERYGADLDVA